MSHSCKCNKKQEQKFCCQSSLPTCPTPVVTSPPLGTISGTVVVAGSDTPIAGVSVSIARASVPAIPIATAVTNASGQYAITVPAPGLYIVTFSTGTSGCGAFAPNSVFAPVFANQTTIVDSACVAM